MSTIRANTVVGAEGGSLKQFITRPFQGHAITKEHHETRFPQLDSHVNPQVPYTFQTAGSTNYSLYQYDYIWAATRSYGIWYYCDTDAVVGVNVAVGCSYCYSGILITDDSTFTNWLRTNNNTYTPYGNMSSTWYLVPAGHWYRVPNDYGCAPQNWEMRISVNDDVITSGSPF